VGFLRSDKTANLDQRTYVAEQGYVVASVEYRTVTTCATLYGLRRRLKSAIRYLRAHADRIRNQHGRGRGVGQSAGGYLAAMTGVTDGLKQFENGAKPGPEQHGAGRRDEFGPCDISTLASDYDVATQDATYAAGNSFAQFIFAQGTTLSVAGQTHVDGGGEPGHLRQRGEPAVSAAAWECRSASSRPARP